MLRHLLAASAGLALALSFQFVSMSQPIETQLELAKSCGRCGDGACVASCGETASTCPSDCGGATSVTKSCGRCGDGACVASCGETASTCPRDCGSVAS